MYILFLISLFDFKALQSKGGNYLLNLGPDINGIIPEESVKALFNYRHKMIKQFGLNKL
jgi:alpha-L-fucosidase